MPRKFCLVVEAESDQQARLCNIVHHGTGAKCHVVATLAAALEAASKYKFDMVVLDNAMPDGRGISLVLHLRSSPVYRSVPIILFNDWNSPFLNEKAQSAKVSMMMSKRDFHPTHARRAMLQASKRLRALSKHTAPHQFPESADPSQVADPASPPGADAETPLH